MSSIQQAIGIKPFGGPPGPIDPLKGMSSRPIGVGINQPVQPPSNSSPPPPGRVETWHDKLEANARDVGPRDLPDRSMYEQGMARGVRGVGNVAGAIGHALNPANWSPVSQPLNQAAPLPPSHPGSPVPAAVPGATADTPQPAGAPAGTRFPVASGPTPHADALNAAYRQQGIGVQGGAPSATPGVNGATQADVSPVAARPSWQPGQPAQWPIQPMPQGSEPFEVARLRMINGQADVAERNGGKINDWAAVDRDHAAQNDLFKQYHGGWNPGDYQSLARQGINVNRGANSSFEGQGATADTHAADAERNLYHNGSVADYQGQMAARQRQEQIGIERQEAASRIATQAPDYAAKQAEAIGRSPIGRSFALGKGNPGTTPEATEAQIAGKIQNEQMLQQNAAMPGHPVSASDIESRNYMNLNPGVGEQLAPGGNLLQALRVASGQPGFGQPGSVASRVLQSHLNRRFASANDWRRETQIPVDPFSGGAPHNIPLATGAAGMWMGLSNAMFGGDEGSHGGGYGPGWHQNYGDRVELQDLLKRGGLQSPQDYAKRIGVPPAGQAGTPGVQSGGY